MRIHVYCKYAGFRMVKTFCTELVIGSTWQALEILCLSRLEGQKYWYDNMPWLFFIFHVFNAMSMYP